MLSFDIVPGKCAHPYRCVRFESCTSNAAIVGYQGAFGSEATHDPSCVSRVGSPTSGPLAACSSAGTEFPEPGDSPEGLDAVHTAKPSTANAPRTATSALREPWISLPPLGRAVYLATLCPSLGQTGEVGEHRDRE